MAGKLKLNINLRKHSGLSVHLDEVKSKIKANMINIKGFSGLCPATLLEIIKFDCYYYAIDFDRFIKMY